MTSRVIDTHELLKDLVNDINALKERVQKLEIQAENAEAAVEDTAPAPDYVPPTSWVPEPMPTPPAPAPAPAPAPDYVPPTSWVRD